jgi:Protein of unknown function (DUF3352)
MRKLVLTLLTLAITVVAAAGCGDTSGAASGASELVPAGSVAYGEVTLDPEGDQKQAIDTILSKFPGEGQAVERLKALIGRGLRESSGHLSYEKDVEPWLGDEAAFFAGGVGQSGELDAAAALVATTDEDRARDALEKSAEGKTEKHTYKDVDYLTDESGEAGAVFDGFLMIGTEPGIKAAIEASKGGKTLSDDDAFEKATEHAASDRLGLLYVNSQAFVQQAGRGGVPLAGSLGEYFKQPFVVTAVAKPDGIELESTLRGEQAKGFSFFGQSNSLLTGMPADSWLAVGQKDLGKLLNVYVDGIGSVLGGRAGVEQRFKAFTGLDLEHDVLSWMGDYGVFVRGTTLSDLGGALVVETSDEAASERFLAALERLAKGEGERVTPLSAPKGATGFTLANPSLGRPIDAFVQDGKVVFAYGDAAANDAVSPDATLSDSPDFKAQRDSLGDYDVSLYVLTKPILDLVDSTSAGSDAGWQEAKRYIEPLTGLVAGTSGSGDDLKSALKLVVK